MDVQIKFKTIDFWNRPVYQLVGKEVLIGDVDKLWDGNTPVKEINDYYKNNLDALCIFGTNIDDDPLGSSIKKSINLVIVED